MKIRWGQGVWGINFINFIRPLLPRECSWLISLILDLASSMSLEEIFIFKQDVGKI